MRPTLFISDLHLCTDRSGINQIFFDFLNNQATQAQALYILGDLFEYWAGDDDLTDPFNSTVVAALQDLSARGVALYLMHGNRDVLLGKLFADACGATLLPDPSLIDLYGIPTLLMHGDSLCTDDEDYQAYRAQVHAADWQQQFLTQPLTARKAFIQQLREKSEHEKRGKSQEIMDVAEDAVKATLRQHHHPRLIHGHTHRPARHLHSVDGKTCERWVLSDWYDHGEYLRCDEAGCVVEKL